jgi:hypothetical protein
MLSRRTHVQVFVTSDDDPAGWPNKANIQQAFRDIAARAKPEDLLVIYFSGHGVDQGSDWYFLTAEAVTADVSDPLLRQAQAISWEELLTWVKQVAALKQVLILDACASGTVVESMGKSGLTDAQAYAIERMQKRTGMHVLAGSASSKKSYEATQFGHGLLTYAILDAFKSGRGLKNGAADVSTWFEDAINEVPKLALQIGTVQRPVPRPGRESFDIGLFPDSLRRSIPVRELPTLVGVHLREKTTWADPLDLTARCNALLERAARTGNEFVWIPTNYTGAYTIVGEYQVTRDQCQLEVRVFKAGTEVTRLVTTQPLELVEEHLVGAVLQKLRPLWTLSEKSR